MDDGVAEFPPYLPVMWCSRTGLLAVKEQGTGRMFRLAPSRNSPGAFEVLPEHGKPASGAAERPKLGRPARSPFAVIDGGKDNDGD